MPVLPEPSDESKTTWWCIFLHQPSLIHEFGVTNTANLFFLLRVKFAIQGRASIPHLCGEWFHLSTTPNTLTVVLFRVLFFSRYESFFPKGFALYFFPPKCVICLFSSFSFFFQSLFLVMCFQHVTCYLPFRLWRFTCFFLEADSVGEFGVAVIVALWTFDGWNSLNFITEEVCIDTCLHHDRTFASSSFKAISELTRSIDYVE